MRICSFVPGATEVVAALGLSDSLVGISHECDYPMSVRHAPVLIRPAVSSDAATSIDIDRRVKEVVSSGRRLYRLDEQALIDANPDTILTQDLCHVCAVTPDQLDRATQALPRHPRMLTLSPSTLEDVIHDVERIGEAVDCAAEGRRLAETLRQRVAAVQEQAAGQAAHPRVLCLEWLSPLYIGGHWVPDMVQRAGGTDVLGSTAAPSRETNWQEIGQAKPEVVILMPCGFSSQRAYKELQQLAATDVQWSHALATWPHTFIVDAASYFSRPGPRLVDGLELLAAVISGDSWRRFGAGVVRQVPASFVRNGLSS